MVDLTTPLSTVLKDSAARTLERELGLVTVGDLLYYLPRRHDLRGELTDLADLRPGEHVTVFAEVLSVTVRRMQRRAGTVAEVVVGDGRRQLTLTLFNQNWRRGKLAPGTRALFAGQLEVSRRNLQLKHPLFLSPGDADWEEEAVDFAGGLVPIYPATANLTTVQIRKAVRQAMRAVDRVADPLPAELRRRHGLAELDSALRTMHRPPGQGELAAARHRLAWDEALVVQLALARRRQGAERVVAVPRPVRRGGLLDAFDAALPFRLTPGQQAVGARLAEDLAGSSPMHRLLQGEVGSGKTVVALRAMLTVVDAGGQAVLLAPTEVLAVQHLRTLRDLLGPLGSAGELGSGLLATGVALLTGSRGAAARRAALAAVADGTAGLVVGTHALLEEEVAFRDLGLVVVDEQHRFGVEQRDALRARAPEGRSPHLLVMTATPIPRTVAMTVFGDLETSELTEIPAGRPPVRTFVVPAAAASWVDRMWGRVRDEVAAGHQAFVVCPRIDAEEAEAGAAVTEVAARLAAGELASCRVAALFGRLPAEEKDALMTAFAAGRTDVLVSTTVIEVGVDVPNATVMVVLDADRFGISQLHQLRGRVGRGGHPSWCLLHSAAFDGSAARDRLDAVAGTTDGARLAVLDLRARREGDVLGVAQSGTRGRLRLLSLLDDEDIITAARAEAAALVSADPELAAYPALRAALDTALDEDTAAYLDKA
ncbi:MAG: ATP-dependent DNA helicase RecG [Mycobacteriales bacterium]